MSHPLTDEMIDEIQMRFGGPCSECNDDMNMRAAYDLAIKHVWAKVDVQLAELRKYAGGGEKLHIAWILETYFERAMHCQLPQEDNS